MFKTAICLTAAILAATAGAPCALALSPTLAAGQAADGENAATATILVVPEDGQADDIPEIGEMADKCGVTVEGVSEFENGGVRAVTVSAEDEAGAQEAAQRLSEAIEETPEVAEAHPSKRFKVMSSKSNPKRLYQYVFAGRYGATDGLWGLKRGVGLGFENVRKLAKSKGRGATIAVIDSGFRKTHAELRGQLLTSLAYNALTDRGGDTGNDKCDHGTAMASLLVARKNNGIGGYGVCANTKILPLTCADAAGEMDDVDILECLEYIEKLVASGKVKNLHVINCSFGSWYSDAEKAALGYGNLKTDPLYAQMKRLRDEYGIVCVCAGGNGSDDGCARNPGGWVYPGDYPCCVSVMASDIFGQNCSWSDMSPEKDLTAPSDGIAASSASDTAIEADMTGSSYSAAYISGAISSLLQINPRLSAWQAFKLLKKHAQPAYGTSYCSWNPKLKNGSAGIPNVETAAWEAERKATGKKIPYWKGLTDYDHNRKYKMGYEVLSSEKRTVRLISSGYTEKGKKRLVVPSRVRLGDGKLYDVVSVGGWWCGAEGRVQKVVLGKNVRELCKGALALGLNSREETPRTVVVKTRKLTRKSVEDCLTPSFEKSVLPKMVVSISKNRCVNKRYLEKYRKFFAKENSNGTVKRFVAA